MAHVKDWLTLTASGAIAARRIVALENKDGDFSGTAGQALQADGPAAAAIGVSGMRDVADKEVVEVAVPGSVAEVVYGANVESGDLLAADADGKARPTTTAGNRTVGIAMIDGRADDIGEVLVSPGSV